MQIRRTIAVPTLAIALFVGVGFAQNHHEQDHRDQHTHYVQHKEWKKGHHIQRNDWDRGERVDWHARRLSTPPKGYEWRLIDGNYVCADANNVIFSVTVASRASDSCTGRDCGQEMVRPCPDSDKGACENLTR